MQTRQKSSGYGHYNTPESQQQAKLMAAKKLFQLLRIGALTGATAGGVAGLRQMMTKEEIEPTYTAYLPQPLAVPGVKRASLEDAAAKVVAPYLFDTHTSNPILNEWGIPAGMLAVGTGLYGGYQGVTGLLNRIRKAKLEKAKKDAERDYNASLATEYNAAMMGKSAAVTDEIDSLYPLTKTALTPSALKMTFGPVGDAPYVGAINAVKPGHGYDTWEAIKGTANAAILALLLGSGKASYDWTKKNNKQKILEQALKQRQARRRLLSPPPIVATPE